MSFPGTVTRGFRSKISEESAAAGADTVIHTDPSVSPHAALACPVERRWAVLLAGGDGMHLRALTSLLYGDDRPKQFCPLICDDTLLEQTRKRAAASIASDHLLILLNASHRDYYTAERGIRPAQRIVQPANKGTAPAIVYSLLSIAQQDPNAVVAVLPCDHYYGNEFEYNATLNSAFDIASEKSDTVVLLAEKPHGPDIEYGWIELGSEMAGYGPGLIQIKRLRDKPSYRVAQQLFDGGSLWNTSIMVGHVQAFLAMVAAALPDMVELFRKSELWSGAEVTVPASLYVELRPLDLSQAVLSSQTARLVALRGGSSQWSHLGCPRSVLALVHAAGLRPAWAKSRPRSNSPCLHPDHSAGSLSSAAALKYAQSG